MLVSNELKSRGISDFIECNSSMACIAALGKDPSALLITDTEQEERELIRVLRAAQGPFRMDTRPIYLIPYSPSEKILALAVEYNILQLHVGDISGPQIQLNFIEITRYGQRSPFELKIYSQVIKARKSHKKDEARDLLLSLCRAEPENLQAANELGSSLCELDLWGDAEKHLIGIVARYPFDTRAKHLLARCFMKKSDYSKARYYLEQASILSPFNAERMCELGQVFLDQYQLAEALGSFREVLALEPELQEARLGEAQCELLLNDANEMIKIARQLQDPFEFASVFNGAAIVAVRAGHFQKGISLYRAALAYLVDYPYLLSRVFFNMGIGLWKWGKGKLAIAAFEKAVALDPTNTKARHNADCGTIKLKRLNDSKINGEDDPFSSINSIDTMDDRDGFTEEDFSPRACGS